CRVVDRGSTPDPRFPRPIRTAQASASPARKIEVREALSEFDWSKDPRGREKISELNRRLHNYVTARMSLRDHTIAALEPLGVCKESAWYKNACLPKIKAILVKASFAFLQALRNYVSHWRIRPLNAGIRVSAEGIEQP